MPVYSSKLLYLSAKFKQKMNKFKKLTGHEFDIHDPRNILVFVTFDLSMISEREYMYFKEIITVTKDLYELFQNEGHVSDGPMRYVWEMIIEGCRLKIEEININDL